MVNEVQSRWDEPVIYLREYPQVLDNVRRGLPYFECELCHGRLELVPASGDDGVMYLCVYSCGQRYWIDKS